MALNATVLAQLIQTKTAAEFGAPIDPAVAAKAAKAIAEAVIEHITTLAVVNVTVAPGIALLAGVYPGATTAPGTGVGTIS